MKKLLLNHYQNEYIQFPIMN
ncbi:hypothetical protein AGR7C_Cc100007 [Agrobacterium deltaense Zutra 3/1]|uniref:Uncharacterized protein n=1 Tax=Agrobacterium deltaense Zutra 3/1 TaxID=1183427 RepID=A0A1S7NUP0_9HYPH|nr:hypothetical protein AGR7C_Cc100007 [Agrobacterium deltaense Zutra 3/1]